MTRLSHLPSRRYLFLWFLFFSPAIAILGSESDYNYNPYALTGSAYRTVRDQYVAGSHDDDELFTSNSSVTWDVELLREAWVARRRLSGRAVALDGLEGIGLSIGRTSHHLKFNAELVYDKYGKNSAGEFTVKEVTALLAERLLRHFTTDAWRQRIDRDLSADIQRPAAVWQKHFESTSWRLSALSAVSARLDASVAVRLVTLMASSDSDAEVRLYAVELLGEFVDVNGTKVESQSVPPVQEGGFNATAPLPRSRRGGSRPMPRLTTGQRLVVATVLVERFLQDSDGKVRLEAVTALGRHPANRVVLPLLIAANGQNGAEVEGLQLKKVINILSVP